MVSSIGATAMPFRASTSMSYFRFWPIFSTAGSSSSGLRRASARLDLDLSGHRIAAEEPAARGLVAQRDVAGLAGCGGQRHAHQIGLHRIQRIGLGVDGEIALGVRLGDPAFERCKSRSPSRSPRGGREWPSAHRRWPTARAAQSPPWERCVAAARVLPPSCHPPWSAPPSGGQKEISTGAGSIAAMSASSSPATFLVKLVNSRALRKPMSWEALG